MADYDYDSAAFGSFRKSIRDEVMSAAQLTHGIYPAINLLELKK